MARLFFIKPLTAAVGTALLAGHAQAADLSLGSTCLICDPATLRNSTAATPAPAVHGSGLEAPPADHTRITADEIHGQTKVSATAQGDVVVERNNQILNADWVKYDQKNQRIEAGDHFVLLQDGSLFYGEKLNYNLTDGSGEAAPARVEAEHEGRRLQAVAEKAELIGKGRYTLRDVQFNTCEKNDASWYIRAQSVEADYDKGIGVARHARLVFGGVPILYTPWADFPLNGKRKSGLLVPTLEIGSDGTQIDLPYYFNLAPNYDFTLTPGLISSRGARLGGEFRYLMPTFSGKANGTWMPDDKQSVHNNRYHAQWEHKHQITPTLSGGISFNQVSDDDYYRDFYGRDDIASNVNLNRQVWLQHDTVVGGGYLQSYATVQKYQTLANSNGYKNPPYAILPRISSSWEKGLGDSQIRLEGQYTHFEHDSRQAGSRLVFYPSISHNFHNSWGYIRPKIGAHYTYYSLNRFENTPGRSLTRTLPVINIDAGLTLERSGNLWGRDYVQTLEPRLFYNYIPTKAQNDLPNFDTSENSFNYQQLFRENLYSGNDRINASNSLTTALQTRYLDKHSGEERFRAGIGQKFYFTTDSVQLDGSVSTGERNRSDWLAFADGKVSDSISANASVHYNESRQHFQNAAAGILYRPEPGKALSLRYKYGRHEPIYLQSNGEYYYDKLSQLDVGAQWPVNNTLSLIGRLNYGLDHKQPLSQMVGFEYKSVCGCWSTSVVAHRYVTGIDGNNRSTYKNAILFSLQLRDLSNIGQSPRETLRLAIPGYSKTNEVVNR